MRDYRLYCLDGAGKITSAEWLEAQSDEEAITIVRSLRKAMTCEVWHRNRFVARIPRFTAAGASTAVGPDSSPLLGR